MGDRLTSIPMGVAIEIRRIADLINPLRRFRVYNDCEEMFQFFRNLALQPVPRDRTPDR